LVRGDAMVKVIVNGTEVEVEEGATLLRAIQRAGYEVPTLCLFGHMYREASCRVCLVELSNGKLVPACAYPVSEGLRVLTDTPKVRRVRRTVIELILATHKTKCWECLRKGGHCLLLKLASEYGVEGIPVCAECPLYGEDCLVVRGYPCLGPITVAGCGAQCPLSGSYCIGCRGPITRKDTLREAARFYAKYGVNIKNVLSLATIFWGRLSEFNLVRSELLNSFTNYFRGGGP